MDLLLELLLYVPYHVHLGGREAPPLDFHSKVLIPGFVRGAPCGPRRGCVSLPRAPCCVRLAKKYALCWLRCALAPFLRSNLAVGPRFCSLGRSPGPDLPCLNDRFAASHAARARVTPTSSNSVKTPLKLSRNACRPVCAKRRSRRKNVASALRDACCATAAYDFRVSASPPPSGVFPEAPRTLLAPLGAAPARPRSHPGASWHAFGASPERPGTACDGFCLPDWAPRGVLERLGLDFGSSGKVRVVSWDAFRVRFSHVLAFRVTPCLRACDSVRPTKRKKKKWRFRFRPAFGCSCSPARLPRLFP